MSRGTRIPPKALRELWDKVPKMIGCDGRCSESCGPVAASELEHELIEERAGRPLGTNGRLVCALLLPNGRCSVYSIRPLMCRLWGAVEGMPCPYGCKPERRMSDLEAQSILMEIEALSGNADLEASARRMLDQMSQQERLVWQGKVAERQAKRG